MCVGTYPVHAVTIKKAAPVATKSASLADTATSSSLIPTVVGLISGVQRLTQQQKALTAECMPTSAEIVWVDNIVKEWAKTGAMTAEDAKKALGRGPCAKSVGGYAETVRMMGGTDDTEICYDWFSGAGNDGMVWYGFPKVGKATYCDDGSMTCSEKDKKTVSDIYDIFNLVGFAEADYTTAEATMAARLIAKIEKCSYSKLSAKKRAMWSEFLVDSISNIGQETNTGTIMQAVSGISGGGSSLNSLQSMGASMIQFMQ